MRMYAVARANPVRIRAVGLLSVIDARRDATRDNNSPMLIGHEMHVRKSHGP